MACKRWDTCIHAPKESACDVCSNESMYEPRQPHYNAKVDAARQQRIDKAARAALIGILSGDYRGSFDDAAKDAYDYAKAMEKRRKYAIRG